MGEPTLGGYVAVGPNQNYAQCSVSVDQQTLLQVAQILGIPAIEGGIRAIFIYSNTTAQKTGG
jgi:hypothetical protein